MALSERQLKLIEAIINEYIESSEPVGSKTIVKKYAFKVSPATVRNEMACLLDEGFLEMVHTSSGRVPTPMAYKLFVEELMEEQEIPVLQEVAIKQRLWPSRFEFEKLLRQAVVSLADVTSHLALATTNDGYLVHAGAVNVLEHPEFWDIDVAKAALHLLDRFEIIDDLLKKGDYAVSGVKIIIGDEFEQLQLHSCVLVYSDYSAGSKNGCIGILGPSRMKYQQVVPAVRYAKNLVEELGCGW